MTSAAIPSASRRVAASSVLKTVPPEAIRAIREILGVGEAAWDDYLKTDPATRAIVDELFALEKK